MIVGLCPFSVSHELSPAAVSYVLGILSGGETLYLGGGALPERRVSGVPSSAVVVMPPIFECEAVSVDIHYVEEQSGSPCVIGPAEAERFT